jgi:hypothetical protein
MKRSIKVMSEAKEKSPCLYPEGEVTTVQMGGMKNQVYVENGVVYAKFSPIMRYLGYIQLTKTPYIRRIGEEHFRKVSIGGQEQWFMNVEGFSALLRITRQEITQEMREAVYGLFGAAQGGSEPLYAFTVEEMEGVFSELWKEPFDAEAVRRRLLAGRRL